MAGAEVGRYVLEERNGRLILSYYGEGGRMQVASTDVRHRHWLAAAGVKGEVPATLAEIDEVAKLFVALRLLPYARSGRAVADALREMSDFELHYWYYAILRHGMRAVGAMKKLYRI
ncbi:MAG: hypothetical protein ACP5G6_04835 [Conexivisphaera sp.]